ncbi:Obg-like ATPase 1 [Haematococcus lacustris]|uniref:Obg-like ATPase 1 n=1 Tax=Haematococcus lacustris TaxID=44745 RepID=A0A699ZNF0_HAELA|nr:Obg-like ATPase 1 [Haematococcus lacustris]
MLYAQSGRESHGAVCHHPQGGGYTCFWHAQLAEASSSKHSAAHACGGVGAAAHVFSGSEVEQKCAQPGVRVRLVTSGSRVAGPEELQSLGREHLVNKRGILFTRLLCLLQDISRIEGVMEAIDKLRSRGLKKEQLEEYEVASRILACLQGGKDVRFGDWSAKDIEILNVYQLLTAKPVVYLVNLSKQDYIRKKNKFLKPIFDWVSAHGNEPLIPFSGIYENQASNRWWGSHSDLVDLPDDEKARVEAEAGAPSALPKIITQGFKAWVLREQWQHRLVGRSQASRHGHSAAPYCSEAKTVL